VNAAFTGDSRKFAPGTQQPQLGDAFSARIGSLEITCIKQIAMLRHWNRTIARLGIHGNSALNRGEEKARRAL
jgi:hypothetical protein